MAGSVQSKKTSRRKDRLAPSIAQGSSRVSKVVGAVGSQSARVEQRASSSAPRQSSRGQSSPRRAANGSSQEKRGGQGTKKGSSPNPARSAMVPPPPRAGTADSRIISKARNAWSNMEPHHQQGLLSVFLLLLALILFAALTIFRDVLLLQAIRNVFLDFFGWSAYLLAIGLVAFAIAHLIEGIQNKRFIRWPFVIGLVLLWLIVLAESQLLLATTTGGILGQLLVIPLLGWNPAIGH